MNTTNERLDRIERMLDALLRKTERMEAGMDRVADDTRFTANAVTIIADQLDEIYRIAIAVEAEDKEALILQAQAELLNQEKKERH